jgi:HD-like signal output (HDOD) protein
VIDRIKTVFIEDGRDLPDMETNEKIENKVAELIDRLPPMPQNIESLLRSAQSDGWNEEELIELTLKDPGLCADILHIANSFYDTPGYPIETITDAVRIVGPVILVQTIGVWYAGKIILKEFSLFEHLDNYFSHCQEISMGCQILSEVSGVKPHSREVLVAAGLIHDIGRLVILLAGNQIAENLMGTPWNQMKSIIHDERQRLGMDHCIIGQQICKRWNFSSYMQDGILRHHSPLIKDDFNYLGGMIFTAHFVTASDFTGEMLSLMFPVELFDRLGLSSHDFKQAQENYSQLRGKINQ